MRAYTFILISGLAFLSSFAFGQTKRTQWYSKENGLCSQTIIIDSSGYFFKEQGCEGNSTISFGRYKISKGNIISFYFLPFDSLPPIREIKRFKNTNDSTLTFTLIDRYGKPFPSSFNLEAVDINGKTETVYSIENGKVILNRNHYSDLLITPLLWIYKEQAPLVTGDENQIEVHFNLPDLFLTYSPITTEVPKKLQLVLKDDGLYKLDKKTKVYHLSN